MKNKSSIQLSFIGDVSLNDNYRILCSNGHNPFKEIKPILTESDFVVANLECLAKGDEGYNELKKPRLSTDLDTLNYLNELNLKLVSLANNHVYDNLTDGFVKTTEFLKKNDIAYIGAGLSEEEATKPYLLEQNGLKIAIFAYVHEDTNPSLPANCNIHLNWYKQEKIAADLNKFMDCDFKILYMHWGGIMEGAIMPDMRLKYEAEDLFNLGADLIVGHHSHTFQPFEKKGNKMVFYSIGNFCFSDIESDGKIKKIDKKSFNESAILQASFIKSNYQIKLHPIINKNLFILPNNYFKNKIHFRNFLFKLFQIKIFWNVYLFHHNYLSPIIYQLFRHDDEKSLMQRLFSLNLQKINKLFNK